MVAVAVAVAVAMMVVAIAMVVAVVLVANEAPAAEVMVVGGGPRGGAEQKRCLNETLDFVFVVRVVVVVCGKWLWL